MWSFVCLTFSSPSVSRLSPSFFSSPQGDVVILEGGSRPPPAFPHSSVCLFVYLWVDRRREGDLEGRNWWGLGWGRTSGGAGCVGGGEGGGGPVGGETGLCCNMMFILVMYLTVEDNRGLSVWLYEKNLNTNTKTFVDEHLREIL